MLWTVLFTIMGTIVAVVAIALVVGARLPREHIATVRVRLAASPQVVWSVLADPLSATQWRKDLKRVEKVADINGHAAWKEESGFGIITYELTESTEGVSRTTRIADENLPYGGQWEYRLLAAGAGTDLMVTERGFVKPALFRFMSRYIFGYTATMQGILAELGTKLGERVEPEVIASGK
jgi:hypothetical protein